MPRQYSRSRRIADLVQRELAPLLQRELFDSNVGIITVSAVDISPDLKNARIFITRLGGDQGMPEVVDSLNDKAGHFRHELAKVLVTRSVPKLKFEYDISIERAEHLTGLIDSVSKSDEGT